VGKSNSQYGKGKEAAGGMNEEESMGMGRAWEDVLVMTVGRDRSRGLPRDVVYLD
jgi:hypothetical protein